MLSLSEDDDVDEAILPQDAAREATSRAATLPPDDFDKAFLRTLTDNVDGDDVLAPITSATNKS